MYRSADREDLIDPAILDGRIAFASAALLLAFGFVALLDRVGAPEGFVSLLAPVFTIAALALLGFLLHSMQVSRYYAAGRAVPAAYAGFANAGVLAGLGAPFAAEFAGRSWFTGVGGGFFLGVALVGLLLGPVLRKSGVFSFSSLLSARFPGFPARIGVIGVTAFASVFVALAGQQAAVDSLSALIGGGRGVPAFFVAVAALLIAGPGGLFGVVWAAAAAAGVAVVGFGWPAAALALRGELPSEGAGWATAGVDLQGFGVLAPSPGLLAGFGVAISVALGVATLGPALAPAIATADANAARRAGYATLGWSFVFATLFAIIAAASTLALARMTLGQAPDRLPSAIYDASRNGDLTVCGAFVPSAGQARTACAAHRLAGGAPLRPRDIRVANGFLLDGLPELADLGAAANGAVVSAIIALALALAAAGLQSCATALGHEALYRMRGELDLTSRRLALTRLVLVGVASFGATASAASAFDAATLATLALAVSTAALAPATLLAFWPRARDRDAVIAIYAGLFGLVAAVASFRGGPEIETVALAGLAGAVFGLGAGAISALAAPVGPTEGRAFLLRLLRGDGRIAHPDKGA